MRYTGLALLTVLLCACGDNATRPDASLDAGSADGARFDGGAVDVATLDARQPDAALPDAALPDAAAPDAAAPDAALPDAAAPDAAAPDAAAPDASSADASPSPGLCDPQSFPMNKAAPLACCLKGDDEWFISGNTPSKLVHRVHGTACTVDGVTRAGCLGSACLFGPCGARILETFDVPAYVFYPVSDPTVCGRQGATLPGVPEAWTAASTPYPSATTACPYTDCAASGPTVKLTVTTTATAASGTVTSTPAGINATGAGTFTAVFSDPAVMLTATPSDAHARAVLSGACTTTGDFGAVATCALVLGPDKTVQVSFECEAGFTCPL